MGRVEKVRVLLGPLVVLIAVLVFGAGCGQGGALEEQQRDNEELRRELAAQEAEQKKAEERRQAAERSQMMQQNEKLEQENEELKEERDRAEQRIAEEDEQEQEEPQQTAPPETETDSPDVIIQSNDDWTAPPSQATEGVVVVAPDYNVQAVTTEEAYALDAAIAYYQEVEVGDYYATHRLLSVEDQSLYTLDEWVTANTNLDSAAGEFVVTDAYPADVGNYSPTYAVTVTVYLTDGSVIDRTTYFTDEGNGYWAHWLSTEEMNLFDSAL